MPPWLLPRPSFKSPFFRPSLRPSACPPARPPARPPATDWERSTLRECNRFAVPVGSNGFLQGVLCFNFSSYESFCTKTRNRPFVADPSLCQNDLLERSCLNPTKQKQKREDNIAHKLLLSFLAFFRSYVFRSCLLYYAGLLLLPVLARFRWSAPRLACKPASCGIGKRDGRTRERANASTMCWPSLVDTIHLGRGFRI